jgi:hypothetical protein
MSPRPVSQNVEVVMSEGEAARNRHAATPAIVFYAAD